MKPASPHRDSPDKKDKQLQCWLIRLGHFKDQVTNFTILSLNPELKNDKAVRMAYHMSRSGISGFHQQIKGEAANYRSKIRQSAKVLDEYRRRLDLFKSDMNRKERDKLRLDIIAICRKRDKDWKQQIAKRTEEYSMGQTLMDGIIKAQAHMATFKDMSEYRSRLMTCENIATAIEVVSEQLKNIDIT